MSRTHATLPLARNPSRTGGIVHARSSEKRRRLPFWQVLLDEEACRWRHGRDLPREAAGTGGFPEDSGGEEDPRPPDREQGVHRSLPRRGPARGADEPPQRGP